MTPSSEELRLFLSRFRGVPFPHASEVMSLLGGETAGVTIHVSTGASLEKLRTTYRIRAELLASRQSSPASPATLPTDFSLLADALDLADEQPVRIWLMEAGDTVFAVFELVDAQQIAGVVGGVVAPPGEELI